MYYFLLTIVIGFISFDAFSKQDICASNLFFHNETKITTGQFHQTKKCYINIANRNSQNLVYRTHLFDTNGGHMVFNSFGNGPANQYTGARFFQYLPRKVDLNYKIKDNLVIVQLRNGHQVLIDSKTAKIIDSIGFELKESDEVDQSNNGGVEILSSVGIYIDFGFKMGNTPIWDMHRNHKIHIDQNTICENKNSELLYKEDYDIYWKYVSDKEIFKYIKKSCLE